MWHLAHFSINPESHVLWVKEFGFSNGGKLKARLPYHLTVWDSDLLEVIPFEEVDRGADSNAHH